MDVEVLNPKERKILKHFALNWGLYKPKEVGVDLPLCIINNKTSTVTESNQLLMKRKTSNLITGNLKVSLMPHFQLLSLWSSFFFKVLKTAFFKTVLSSLSKGGLRP